MDSEFWATRLAAAKRQFNLQHHRLSHATSHLDRFAKDGFEIEEGRPDFPCPYCYEEFDIASLCSHLEDEHSFESKPTVCPVCSVKIARDALSHITMQHGHLFKLQQRRRLRRVPISNGQAMSLLGKDLREAHLNVLLGGSAYRSSNSTSSDTVATDPFLSSLIMNFSSSESEDISKSLMSSIEEISAKNVVSQPTWKPSDDSSLSREEKEKRSRQAAERAIFLQDLLASALFFE